MKNFLSILCLLLSAALNAQELFIRNIQIDGLKTTKEATVLRELSFSVGDHVTFQELHSLIDENKSNLINQWLFNFVDLTPIINGSEVEIILTVTERWYVWPYPIFEISERNFNVFWDSLRHSNFEDFSRLNYGVFLNWYNFRGRNELLKIKYRKGFKEHYLFEYDIPYLNQEKTWGAVFKKELFRMQKFHYRTDNHLLLYTLPGDNLFKEHKLSLTFQYKPGIHNSHKFEIEGNKMCTKNSVENPAFFLSDSLNFQYARFDYQFIQEKRDYKEYPLEGYMRELSFEAFHGIANNYHNIIITAKADHHYKLHPRWSVGNSIKAKLSWKKEIPYFLSQAFGFEDYLRGYEYYVIDGSQFAMTKTALKWTLFPKKKMKLPLIPWEQFSKTHFSIFFSIFVDMGYVYNHEVVNNPLNNEFLMSQGFSIDILSYYDKLIRFEYSLNHVGETGFFIHFSNPF